jgi:DNA-binding transcriptional ArsR family regulator
MSDEPEPSAPGTPGNPVTLTDPRMMRALAHPARIAIWQFLGLEGPATATECARVTDLSPSACSYHLRTLARYGFVEEDLASAADARQRPWRARVFAFTISDDPSVPPEAQLAGWLLGESLRATADEVHERYLDRQTQYPGEWRAALGDIQGVLHVTTDELVALKLRFMELFGEYWRLDPAERPSGARRVHVMLDLNPWFEPGEDR